MTAISTTRSAVLLTSAIPRIKRLSFVLRPEILLVGGILLVAGLVHGINMFHFPYPENDEATYMSQAWSIVNEGKLAPYTYWYDHAPLGWMLIAVWTSLTGGFFSFGTAVDSGRVLMLVLQLASTLLLYRIAKSMTGSVVAATLAALLFSLSAFGVYLQRRVLLDNITTFWMLVSIYLLVSGRFTLRRVWASALALGASVLSKELTIFLVPAMAYLVFYRSDRSQRWLAVAGWLAISLSFVSLYVLMASLKGELFPTGTLLGGTNAHVSLLGSLSEQAGRGKDGGLFQAGSAFWTVVRWWTQDEPLLVVGGGVASIVCTLFIKRWRLVGIAGLLTLSLFAFLARGGIVIRFYLVPLLPLWSLDIALVAWLLMSWVTTPFVIRGGIRQVAGTAVTVLVAATCAGGLLAGYIGPYFRANPANLWTNKEADAGTQAIAWIEHNLPPETSIVTDNFLWTDLHAGPASHGGYQLAHYYWKVEKDPEISEGVFDNNWRNIDYLVVSSQVQSEAKTEGFVMVSAALNNSTPIVKFDTGGWPLTVNRVDKLGRISADRDWLLRNQWEQFKGASISNGRVTSAGREDVTLAADQTAALLEAAYLSDRPSFDALWSWTSANLLKSDDGLLAASWRPSSGGASAGTLDSRSDAGADTDMALALLFASKRWNEPAFSTAASQLLDAIWQHETVPSGGLRIVTATDADAAANTRLVRPAALAPYAYRIFGKVDQDHPWLSAVDGSYDLLSRLRANPNLGGKVGLVPDAILVTATNGQLALSSAGPSADLLSTGPDAVTYRMGLDWAWFGDTRALQELKFFSLPRRELSNTGRIVTAYKLNGESFSERESLATYAQSLPALLFGGTTTDQQSGFHVFDERVLALVVGEKSVAPSTADAIWAWRATALLDGALSNLWAGEDLISWTRASTIAPVVTSTSP